MKGGIITDNEIKILAETICKTKVDSKLLSTSYVKSTYGIDNTNAFKLLMAIRKQLILNKNPKRAEIVKPVIDNNYKNLERIRNTYLVDYNEDCKLTNEGFIYLIENTSFDGWLKIGKTLDFERRLYAYNVCDPLKRFKMISVKYTNNRHISETSMLTTFRSNAIEHNGEWFNINTEKAKKLFNSIIVTASGSAE